ncbi:acyltransferase family protein [Streptomyces sp. NBC_00448]|uniref:acyltransferase family protein n=1 Tax=Streptomyces sp. NBC_00448 TaxID=2903652 RepID=UPI002E1F4204
MSNFSPATEQRRRARETRSDSRNGSPSGTPPARKALRGDIQGLRAVAVVLVVLSHAGVRHVAGGYVGVDVFFVVSGFVITSALLRELSSTGGLSIPAFYGRRMTRLLPASSLVVVATLAGSRLYLYKARFGQYVADALSSSLYAVNIRMAATGTDYLAQNSPPSPFQHFWSLAVEEQFYLVWPLLLLAGWKLARRFALPPAVLAIPLGALCLVSLWWSATTTADSPSWAYFGPQTRGWELGAGALVALTTGRLERLPWWVAAPASWAGLAGIGYAAVRFDDATVFPGSRALLPVLAAVAVVGGGCAAGRAGAGALLGLRPATWLGGLSYGWYLWHWPLLVIGPAALHRSGSVRLALALSAVALLLAWVTMRLVENPVRFHRALRARPRRSLAVGLGITAGTVAVSLVAQLFPPAIATRGHAPSLAGTLAAAPDPEASLARLLAAPNDALPSNLTPRLEQVTSVRSPVYQDDCHVGYDATESPECAYGDLDSTKVVVLFGDSHAAQWFEPMDRLARANHWKLVSLTKASCKVADVPVKRGSGTYTSCDTWRAHALARIAQSHPWLVVTSSSDSATPAARAKDPLRQWTDGYARTFRTLRATGARVVALLDTPWPKGDPVDCAAAHPLDLRRCANTVAGSAKQPVVAAAARAAAGAQDVGVIDPRPWLCPSAGTCPVVAADTFVYRDDSHMAEGYSQALTPALGRRLSSLLATPLRTGP